MKYDHWIEAVFGPSGNGSVDLPCQEEAVDTFHADIAFDYVDRMLTDPGIHSIYDKTQLGEGITMIYSNGESDLPFLYTVEGTEIRRIKGIQNLRHLYGNFFERYCTAPVERIGSERTDGPLGYMCYMFWDLFVLYSGNASPGMISAALDVMNRALFSRNENCRVSAIHGLGHWSTTVPEAVGILKRFLKRPTTDNPQVLAYAQAATTGRIP